MIKLPKGHVIYEGGHTYKGECPNSVFNGLKESTKGKLKVKLEKEEAEEKKAEAEKKKTEKVEPVKSKSETGLK